MPGGATGHVGSCVSQIANLSDLKECRLAKFKIGKVQFMLATMTGENQSRIDRSKVWGNGLIRFCGYGLAFSSAVKFVHPTKAVAYMASMGFEGGTFYLVAVLELISAVLFLFPVTRRLGLLLVSSYLGGAIAAHLAVHRFFTGGPFLVYRAMHPYVGALVPSTVLAAGWVGTWLSPAELAAPQNLAHEDARKLGRNFAMGAAS